MPDRREIKHAYLKASRDLKDFLLSRVLSFSVLSLRGSEFLAYSDIG